MVIEKLKTLKDWQDNFRELEKAIMETTGIKELFEEYDVEFKLSPLRDVTIPIEDLRAEAIKWMKSFNKGECHTDFAADERKGQENIVEWIKHFFNITDEELNGTK